MEPKTQSDHEQFGSTALGLLLPAHAQRRRIVIAKENRATGLEAELVQHVFQEANRVPDGEASHSYSVNCYALEDPSSSADAQTEFHAMLEDISDSPIVPDTFVITGSYEPRTKPFRPEYLAWLKKICARSRRIVAIAGGSLHLAAIGLLRDRAAVVSHWSAQQHLEGKFPGLSVRSDILFDRSENIFTCAGALASVDIALHLVEEDLGSAVTRHIAQRLLMPYRRTAICSQVSLTLQAQDDISHPLSALLAWLPGHLTSDLAISKLARKAAMSPRNFARRFREHVGMTPARYIQELRFEAAKRELACDGQSVSGAAERSGFNSAESLRRLFQRRVGLTPKIFRDRVNP